jgi:hypothetical protein
MWFDRLKESRPAPPWNNTRNNNPQSRSTSQPFSWVILVCLVKHMTIYFPEYEYRREYQRSKVSGVSTIHKRPWREEKIKNTVSETEWFEMTIYWRYMQRVFCIANVNHNNDSVPEHLWEAISDSCSKTRETHLCGRYGHGSLEIKSGLSKITSIIILHIL